MRFKKLILVATIMLAFMACKKEEVKQVENEAVYTGKKVTVVEVVDGKTYTYLKVAEKGAENWIAISKRETKVGEVLYYDEALIMENFESKEIGRTFDKIEFVSSVSNQPTISKQPEVKKGNKQNAEKIQIDTPIAAPKDGISIAELYKNRDSYKNKSVILKGKVTKLNTQIMGKNWLHIQDGSSSDKTIDLTVTTNEDVKLGDVVVVKGTIALNKDFGAGYFYEVIMESAKVTPVKSM